MGEQGGGCAEESGRSPLIIVVSGPSGVGKDTLLERMAQLNHDLPLHFVVTATTRPARPGEVDGVNHHFLDRRRFKEKIEKGEFLEWAEVYGNLYGVPRPQVQEALNAGRHVICRVDVQGAARLKALAPESVFVFVLPPGIDALRQRLLERGLDSEGSMTRRLDSAQSEIDRACEFDYALVNEDGRLDETVARLVKIIECEAQREPPRRVEI